MHIMSNTNFGVALLGFGTVGSGVYELLRKEADQIEAKYGFRFDVKKILVRNPDAPRKFALPKALVAESIDEILSDPTIDVVIEVMGGESPAREYILDSLKAGKHVITANKRLCGTAGEKLIEKARLYSRFFGFAGAVTGFHQMIPSIINSVMIRQLVGVFNGTSNYILSRIEDGLPSDAALSEAQQQGYAEADPSEDIDGYDTRNKLIIVTKLAFGIFLEREQIILSGMRYVERQDMQFAKDLGYTIKLLGMSRLIDDDKVCAAVGPCLIPIRDPLAAVRGADNGIRVDDALRGRQGMIAPGAGGQPTAMAIFSDLINMAKRNGILWPPSSRHGESLKFSRYQPPSSYYLRINVRNHPGALAKITKVFGRCNINITKAIQRGDEVDGAVPVVIICGPAEDRDIKQVLRELQNVPDIQSTPLVMRIEESVEETASVGATDSSIAAF
jgi:homoserine dehydrogenase